MFFASELAKDDWKEVPQGLKSVRENSIFHTQSRRGRLNLAQDASPGLSLKGRPSPAGTAGNRLRRNPGKTSVVPAGLNHVS
jgi:hypothetical protein